MWEIKQLTMMLLKGNQRLLGSFLSTDLGKLWLKIASVQINPLQGAQMDEVHNNIHKDR